MTGFVLLSAWTNWRRHRRFCCRGGAAGRPTEQQGVHRAASDALGCSRSWPHPVSIDARPSRVYYDRRRRRDSVRDHQAIGEAGQQVGEDTDGQAHIRITQADRTGQSGVVEQPLVGSCERDVGSCRTDQ